ncbi:uncharacterized protein LOC132281633 [Cornus florida]|uniref:uncharacterized protein LOC132281633 n=1 Tax=Cornus florida TaxID=4283 RepID=UPI00289BB423|nr:uncharacterized protein LOC132281633 [Cornus florida]
MARGLIKHKVGEEKDTRLWLDYWLPNGPIALQLGLNELEILQLHNSMLVDSLISNSHWVKPGTLQLHQFFQTRRFLSQLQELPLITTTPDVIEWLPSPTKELSMSHTYKYFTSPSPVFHWHKLVWFKHHIPKHSLILWMAVKGRLNTLDAKPVLHKHYTNSCYHCNFAWESIDHLFFKCAYTSRIWKFVQEVAGFYIRPDNWTQLLHWCIAHWNSSDFLLHKLLLAAAVYLIWMELNARAINSILAPSSSIIAQVKSCVRARLASTKLTTSYDLKKSTLSKNYSYCFSKDVPPLVVSFCYHPNSWY